MIKNYFNRWRVLDITIHAVMGGIIILTAGLENWFLIPLVVAFGIWNYVDGQRGLTRYGKILLGSEEASQ